MSPEIRAQFLQLHPYQQQRFMELMTWSNAGMNEGAFATDAACEKAILWAKQVEIPPPPPETEKEKEDES